MARLRGVTDLEDAFLECRDLKHSWRITGKASLVAPNRVAREIQCTRCKTKAKDFFTITGETYRSRQYDYPEGYLLKGQSERKLQFKVRDARAELLRRVLKGSK